jgi:hypothetical protein
VNIFYLHREPICAAAMLHDKHVVKMTLETAQILSTVYHRYGDTSPVDGPGLYRPTHERHPSVLWAGDTVQQYTWAAKHGLALALEFQHRYGRVHACNALLTRLQSVPNGMFSTGWEDPPQCMPEELRVPGDAIAAYRQYYLARKVVQSSWTRRDVPSFVKEHFEMAKSKTPAPAAKTAAAPAPAPVAAPAPAAEEKKVPLAKMRGPRGVAETAKITLLAPQNPKREGSKAHAVFSCYKDGMTVGAFCDAVDAKDGGEHKGSATPNLVYDAAHGFIKIEGYEPPGGVIEPKPKAEPKPKKEKATPAENKAAASDAKAKKAAAEKEAREEVMD